jgi:uncharacterized DUF497 family protein
MPVYYYLWTDENAEHISHHGVSEDDFEYVVDGARRSAEQVQRNGRIRVEGRTRDGRLVRCVYERVDDLWVYPITAHDLDRE